MELKALLGDDLYAQVQAKIDAQNAAENDPAKRVKLVDLSEGNYVGREKYDSNVAGLRQQVTDLQAQVSQRETDVADLQNKLTAASSDATKLTEAQKAVTDLQAKYDKERQNWEKKNAQQKYEFMVKEQVNGLKFTSRAAKNEFTRAAIASEFKTEGDTLIGFTDFLEKYKTDDPAAFVAEQKEDPAPPQIVLPKNGGAPAEKPLFGFSFQGVRPHGEK